MKNIVKPYLKSCVPRFQMFALGLYPSQSSIQIVFQTNKLIQDKYHLKALKELKGFFFQTNNCCNGDSAGINPDGDSAGINPDAADLIDSDENLHCFTLPLSSCDIKISVVSQCRCSAGILRLFNISTHSFSRFFLTD